MALEIPGLKITRESSGDMSAHQYRAVAFSSAGGAAIVAARGGLAHGVWLGNSTARTYGDVQVTGVAKLQAGDSSGMEAAITEGRVVVASSRGMAVPSTGAGQHRLGFAMEPLATGSTGVIGVLLSLGITT